MKILYHVNCFGNLSLIFIAIFVPFENIPCMKCTWIRIHHSLLIIAQNVQSPLNWQSFFFNESISGILLFVRAMNHCSRIMVERIDEIKHKVHEKNHRFRQRAIPPEGYTFMSRQMEGRRESTKARFILAKKNGWTKCKKLSFKFLLLGKFNTFCGLIDEAWRKGILFIRRWLVFCWKLEI